MAGGSSGVPGGWCRDCPCVQGSSSTSRVQSFLEDCSVITVEVEAMEILPEISLVQDFADHL